MTEFIPECTSETLRALTYRRGDYGEYHTMGDAIRAHADAMEKLEQRVEAHYGVMRHEADMLEAASEYRRLTPAFVEVTVARLRAAAQEGLDG